MPTSANPGNYERAAMEFLRALRGSRSQRAFARRLGYRGNPITDWEHGRRFPAADEMLRAAQLSKVDIRAAFGRFHPAELGDEGRGGYPVAEWLDAVRGSTPTSVLAARAGVSRYALGRWLRGDARPRVPDFFRVVDAATGRVHDLVAALVPIADVPSLRGRHAAAEAARRAAYDAPWTEAVLRVLESADYRALARHDDAWIAARLAIDEEHVRQSLGVLRRSRAVRRSRGVYRVAEGSVDTRGDAERVSRLLEHWSDVARHRVASRSKDDLFAYNVFSLSAADYERARDMLRRTFREIRSLVASSEPAERVALLNVHLLRLDSG